MRVRLGVLLSTAAALACGCSGMHASSVDQPLGPGETSSDTVVVHTFFPEQRQPLDAGARALHAPSGFVVDIVAYVTGARMVSVTDAGTIYVTQPQAGTIVMLKPGASGRMEPAIVASRLPGVHGIASRDGKMYLATPKQVVVADIKSDGSLAEPHVIIDDLPDGGQHARRTIGIGPDGMLYISVGSDCNACAEPDGEHGTMLRAPLAEGSRQVYAKGLRNTIGFDWEPGSHELWGMDNGIDNAGDDDPPEELNRIVKDGDYGWPFRFGNNHINRLFDRTKVAETAFEKQTIAPVLTYDAHAAPIGMAFYRGSQFPSDYRDSAFIALHGSWNRASAAGYKVVRAVFRDGKPERFEDFLTGFLVDDGKAYIGRPAGIAISKDGALLVSDDANGVIYRVSYGNTKTS